MSHSIHPPLDATTVLAHAPVESPEAEDASWALVLDRDPDMVSYLARALMFFQPGFRVASAVNLGGLAQWLETQTYQVVVEGCLGDGAAEAQLGELLRGVPRVRLQCEHKQDPTALNRPPRLSVLLTIVQSLVDGTVDLGSLPKG